MVVGKFPYLNDNELSMSSNYTCDPKLYFPHTIGDSLQPSCCNLLSGLLTINKKKRIDLESPLFGDWYRDIE